jgi:putative heme-binding domain-containing protein
VLKETASWIVSHHSDWADALAGFLAERLRAAGLNAGERAELRTQLSQFVKHGAVQDAMAKALADKVVPKESHLLVLRVIAAAQLKQFPASWPEAVERFIIAPDVELQRAGVLAARALPRHSGALTGLLRQLSGATNVPADIRLNAFAALRGLSALGPHFAFVRDQLSPTNPVATRVLAASVLASVQLNEHERFQLADAAAAAGPIELPKLLSVFDRATELSVGLRLVDSLRQSKLLPALRAEMLKPHLTNFPSIVQLKADELIESINTDAAHQKRHIDDLLVTAQGGDIRRGQAIFNSTKTACSACHAIGYLGGKVGPDLTKIGTVRNERDLLEAIVYPDASFVRSYEPMIVATKSGEEYSGVLRKDSADEVVLATGPNTEQRIDRGDIAEMRPGSVSVMPSGLAEQITKEELADLLAFLKATRW